MTPWGAKKRMVHAHTSPVRPGRKRLTVSGGRGMEGHEVWSGQARAASADDRALLAGGSTTPRGVGGRFVVAWPHRLQPAGSRVRAVTGRSDVNLPHRDRYQFGAGMSPPPVQCVQQITHYGPDPDHDDQDPPSRADRRP